MKSIQYSIHTDGGSRGNPGPAAIGVVIEVKRLDGTTELVHEFGKTIGETTNNVAEYTAVIEALRYMKAHVKIAEYSILFFLDSALVVNQLNGTFKIKDSKMRMLMLEVRQLEQELGGYISYEAVRREFNTAADAMVNKALDEA